MNLGNALSSLGARDRGPNGTKRLEDALKTFRAALKEQPRKRLPLDWAMTKCSLGNTLSRLGKRDDRPEGIERLNEAVEACKAALEEFTPRPCGRI
jgi:tetratricopeptide (TPR) repeat protein